MNTRLGRKPTPTHNSTKKVHAPKRGCASYPMCFIYSCRNRKLFAIHTEKFPVWENDISRTSSEVLFLYPFLQKGGDANGYQRQKTKADRHEGAGRKSGQASAEHQRTEAQQEVTRGQGQWHFSKKIFQKATKNSCLLKHSSIGIRPR